MDRIHWKPGTMLYPAPAVLVTCGLGGKNNICTVSWTGTLCTEPAMTYISLRPSRYSYEIIKETGEFVINLATRDLAFAVDFCGVKSGREVDKLSHLGLTLIDSEKVGVPSIMESPVSIECRVTEVKPLGSHHLFMARVLGVNADSQYLDRKGAFNLQSADPICYSHGKYYSLGREIGRFGFSVRKKQKGRGPRTRERRPE